MSESGKGAIAVSLAACNLAPIFIYTTLHGMVTLDRVELRQNGNENARCVVIFKTEFVWNVMRMLGEIRCGLLC